MDTTHALFDRSRELAIERLSELAISLRYLAR